jgi:DNA polymerase-3 subunit delta'
MPLPPWLADAWREFAQRAASARMAHAFLLGGPAGLGKRALAEAMLARLLCTAPTDDQHACGQCRGCALRLAGSHPDLVRVGIEEEATQIKIDQIRALSQRLALTPQLGGAQVVLIDPAETLNTEACNALLKTLEEPSAGTVLILVTDLPMRLLATIRSRCQRMDVRFPPRDQALAWLEAQGVSASAARAALELAAGNPGLAQRLADPAQRELASAITAELRDLATGKENLLELSTRWAKDRTAERLRLTVELVRMASWRALGGSSQADAGLARLTGAVEFHKLAAWWGRANQVRDQLSTPLRVDLLLLDLLRDWRALCASPAAQAR